MRVGIAIDHGGFSLKEDLLGRLKYVTGPRCVVVLHIEVSE